MTSNTDSEVLAHLFEEEARTRTFPQAVQVALCRVRGTYGLVVLRETSPRVLVAARMGSPLVLGAGKGETFVASPIPRRSCPTRRS